VARAVFASPVPLISGVGHETDVTITDFVADLRAPTPSVAAELAVPELSDLHTRINDVRLQLNLLLGHALSERQEAVATARASLERHAPSRRFARDRQQLDDLSHRLERATTVTAERQRLALQNLVGRLTVLSPQATLARGYAVVRRADSGQVLTSPDQAPATTPLRITLRDGELSARSVTAEGVHP